MALALGTLFLGLETIHMAHPMASDIQQRALSGDLIAQRELADCLTKGCRGIAPDRVQACAWRIVITASGGPGLTAADAEARRRICTILSPSEQTAALAQAKSLFAGIHGRDLVVPADFFGGPARRNPGDRQ